MREYLEFNRHARGALTVAALLMTAASVGCQVEVGGQTLPSPYYMADDVQYFAPGPEFKLSNEAAALAAHRRQEELAATPAPPEAAARPGWTAPRWR